MPVSDDTRLQRFRFLYENANEETGNWGLIMLSRARADYSTPLPTRWRHRF